jgi:hypothetical protein
VGGERYKACINRFHLFAIQDVASGNGWLYEYVASLSYCDWRNVRHGWKADIDDNCDSERRTLSGAAVANLHACAAILIFVGIVYPVRLEIKWQEPS